MTERPHYDWHSAQEYLEELLSMFLEIGVTGATVLDSVGMGHITFVGFGVKFVQLKG